MRTKRNSTYAVWKMLTAGLVFLPLQEASAHHLTGGELPATMAQGFLSGLAHPVIGLDHLAFVVAIGLLSLRFSRGMLLPLVFMVMGLVGTGLHLRMVNLPAPEILISLSVMLFGLLVALPSRIPLLGLLMVAGLAGIAHGYAYGETIVGAEMVPLAAYLVGFTLVQFAVAMASRVLGRMAFGRKEPRLAVSERLAGLGIGTLGIVFLVVAVRA